MKNKTLKLLRKNFFTYLNVGLLFFSFVSESLGLTSQELSNLDLADQKIEVTVALDFFHEISSEVNLNVDPSFSYLFNQAHIYQIGILNVASQYQAGSQNFALIYQEGTSNIATQIQHGIQNKAISVQLGENNFSIQHQISSGNLAIAYQIGIGNYLEQHQGLSGGNNYQSIVIQQGNFNRAFIYQY